MIASACIAAQIPPQSFGVDDDDLPLIGEHIIELLHEQEAGIRRQKLLDRLRGSHG